MAYHCWFQKKMRHNVWLTDIINFLLEFLVFWLVHSVLSMITLWTLNWRYMVNDFTGFRWINFFFAEREHFYRTYLSQTKSDVFDLVYCSRPKHSMVCRCWSQQKGGYPVIDLEQNLPLIPFQTQINHKLPLLFLFLKSNKVTV